MTYFAKHVGGAQRPLQGFDATCDGVLTADAANQAESQTQKWELTVGKQVTNPMGALHGGCIATLVDIFGTAAIALSAPECGVASSLSVQYVSSAAMKSTVAWTAEIVKRGKRLVVVEVYGARPQGPPRRTRLRDEDPARRRQAVGLCYSTLTKILPTYIR